MNQFNIIVNQITVLSIAVIIGFLARRFKVLDENVKHGLSKVIIKITFPLLIITSITNLNITGTMVKQALLLLLFAYGFIFVLSLTGIVSGKLFGFKGVTYNTHIATIMFGNVIFLGFPLFTAMYPNGEGLFYAIFFYLASDSLLWTVGVILLNKHNNKSKVGLTHLINPNSISFALGLIMLLLGLKLPGVIDTAFSGIGHTTAYLAMLFIGVTLADININTIYKKPSVFVLSILKTIIVPIIAIFIMKIAISLGVNLSNEALVVLILQIAMPCMVTVSVIAKESKADYIYVTECIFISTLISLVSIPFIYYVIDSVLL